MVSMEPGGELVPYYHYLIVDRRGHLVGHLNLRIGTTRHIGLEITKEFRGRSLSQHACRAIAPLVRKYYDKVALTADPDNAASIRIIEKLGAKYLSEIDVPEDDPAFAAGVVRKKRFEWTI
ncbi:MAG: GNAT family N-acetyltransferase [bacterium]|nr:GNAT family N-acetyltransferase [bacterium]